MIVVFIVTLFGLVLSPSFTKLPDVTYTFILLPILALLLIFILGIYRPMRRLMANVAYKRWMKTFGETADDNMSKPPSTRSNRSSFFRSNVTTRGGDMVDEEELRLIAPHQAHFDDRS